MQRGQRDWSAMAWTVASSIRVGAVSASSPDDPVADPDQVADGLAGGLERPEDPLEPLGVVGHSVSTTSGSASPARWVSFDPASSIRSTTPEASTFAVHLEQLVLDGRRPGVDDQDFQGIVGPLGLDGGDGHGVDDVGDQGAAGQVVDRLAQALEDRPDGDRVGRALHRLVGVVAGVEVGEDEHGGPAGDLAVGQLDRATSGSMAASYWIGPSIRRSGRRSRAIAVAWRTLSTSPSCPTPRSSRESSATRGSMPNCEVVPAEATAMSAVPSALGLGPPRSLRRPAPRMLVTGRNTLDTIEVPGLVRANSNAGRMVWAAVWGCPDTIPSARPLWTIMVPK